jgi:poly-beta-1,6-N-acetyl-D-glucosamine synthase
MGPAELWQFLGMVVLFDVPRYLIAAIVLAFIPPKEVMQREREDCANNAKLVSGLIACYNEEHSVRACVESMRASGIGEIVVVNDGSTDRTRVVAATLDVTLINLPERIGKPLACNVGLAYCTGELVLVADADTTFEPDCVRGAGGRFEPGVGGVGLDLRVRNENASLVTLFQSVEYAVAFTAGHQISDAFGILPNVSGAAGLFRRAALEQIGGWDCEVAEDAALASKLRAAGWELRYASSAYAWTSVPETMIDLLMQRLRWDASIITIWWRKFGYWLNPFSSRFNVRNLFTSLDVLVFGVLLPLILPFYLFWLWGKIDGSSLLVLLGAVMIALTLLQLFIVLLLNVPLRLLLYVPLYVALQTLVLRPTRVIALIGELVFNITRRDDYIPPRERWRLT